MEGRPRQDWKASFPILVTELGIVKEVRPDQEESGACTERGTGWAMENEKRKEQEKKA